MQPDQVPMPAAIAARPRDPRGFPVLAITPWRDGVPDFANFDAASVLIDGAPAGAMGASGAQGHEDEAVVRAAIEKVLG